MGQFGFQIEELNLVTNKPNRHHHQDPNRRFHLYVDVDHYTEKQCNHVNDVNVEYQQLLIHEYHLKKKDFKNKNRRRKREAFTRI
jgi:hypothetical protein